jgi:hypothetical protein
MEKNHVPNHRRVVNGDLPSNWIIKMEHKTYSKMGPVSCLIPCNISWGPWGAFCLEMGHLAGEYEW